MSSSCLRGGGVVRVEQVEEARGGVPTTERARMVGGVAEILKPDAAFLLQLGEIRAAVGGEDEGDAETAPRAAGHGFRSAGRVAATVAVCLGQAARDVETMALGLGNGYRCKACLLYTSPSPRD